MRQMICIITLFFTLFSISYSQTIRGFVYESIDNTERPVSGATVRWLGAEIRAESKTDGTFQIEQYAGIQKLIVQHSHFDTDTVEVTSLPVRISLTRIHQVKGVDISAARPSTYFAPTDQKTEVITAKELEKAACCDLSTCFSTNSSVQPEVTDVITDTRELQMLGLSGIYTQVLVDNVPGLIHGLNQSYGVSFIPGPMIDRIFVVKGASSVLQGYESISGLVNVLLKDGFDSDRLYLNAYMNSFLEKQVNLAFAQAFGTWSTYFFGHSVQQARRIDLDGNSFLDVPRITRYSFLNKWSYLNEDAGRRMQFTFKATDEERQGGQFDYTPSLHRGSTSVYGQTIHNRRYEFLNKSEFIFEDVGRLSIHASASYHEQDAVYGATQYDAAQRGVLFDAHYAFEPFEEHTLILGAAYRMLKLEEEITLLQNPLSKTYNGMYASDESIPAVYAEEKMRLFDNQLTLIGGLRFDFHNEHGTVTTPRIFAKYELDAETSIRTTFGAGFHVPHIFSENTFVLSSSRNVIIRAPIEPERAMNYGGSLLRLFSMGELEGSLSIDVFHTQFRNQVVADYDQHVDQIVFENLDDASGSNNLLVELKVKPTHALDTKIAYTFSDVYEKRNGGRKELPFNSRHRFSTALSIAPEDSRWIFSATAEWHGSQRLPDAGLYPVEFRWDNYSKDFLIMNVQATHRWNYFEVYAGIENLFNYTQPNPIINARQPFAQYFEPNFTWGPVKGREIYAGLRLRFYENVDEEEEDE